MKTRTVLIALLIGGSLAGGLAMTSSLWGKGSGEKFKDLTVPPVPILQKTGADIAAGGDQRLVLVAGDPSRGISKLNVLDISGEKISFTSNDLRSPLTVVSFFATCCCLHCSLELGELRKLQEARPELRFVLVSLDTSMTPAVKEFVNRTKLQAQIAHDDKGDLYDAFGMEQLPQTYILDAKGKILMDGRRSGEGREIVSWNDPRLMNLLKRAERGEFLNLPAVPED